MCTISEEEVQALTLWLELFSLFELFLKRQKTIRMKARRKRKEEQMI